MGWNQLEAADHHNVSLFKYKLAEYDKTKDFLYKQLKFNLEPYEKCLLFRKRSGKTQSEVSTAMGCGRFWLRLQETGKVPCDKLLDFWETGG